MTLLDQSGLNPESGTIGGAIWAGRVDVMTAQWSLPTWTILGAALEGDVQPCRVCITSPASLPSFLTSCFGLRQRAFNFYAIMAIIPFIYLFIPHRVRHSDISQRWTCSIVWFKSRFTFHPLGPPQFPTFPLLLGSPTAERVQEKQDNFNLKYVHNSLNS